MIENLSKLRIALLALALAAFSPALVAGEEEDKPYKVDADGNVDWYTKNGYTYYHVDCHVCHGPAGLGSSFGPPLIKSLPRLGYEGYFDVLVNGRKREVAGQPSVMPRFGTNVRVMCYADDIFAYLMARADGVVGRERLLAEADEKPQEALERDEACFQ